MAGELGSKAFSMPSPTTPTTYKATQKKGEAEYVQPMCASFNVQLSLHEYVVFLFMRAWAILCILYSSCGIPFPIWTPSIIFGIISVVMWKSRKEVKKKNQVIF